MYTMLGLRGRESFPMPPAVQGDNVPTLPPEIATDAAIYVGMIMVFYVAIIVLLVGSNLHRIRCRFSKDKRILLANTQGIIQPNNTEDEVDKPAASLTMLPKGSSLKTPLIYVHPECNICKSESMSQETRHSITTAVMSPMTSTDWYTDPVQV
ncbi:unnamed protein product [Meganyctiphanes norvegica]|uniref:Uncharacterized protein n=1 Tax=Meganyctiphanes norvegica TaxID=48144 RepID=A0AAV2QET1_MEGNR